MSSERQINPVPLNLGAPAAQEAVPVDPITPPSIKIGQRENERVNIPYTSFQWHGGNYWWPAFLVSLALTIVTGFTVFNQSGAWPPDEKISPLLGNAPVMSPTERKPFSVEMEDGTADIYPVREYIQAAMITSMAENVRGWTSLPGIPVSHQKINTYDGTVAWGQNITSGVFRLMKYANNGFYGHVNPIDSDTGWAYKDGENSRYTIYSNRCGVPAGETRPTLGDGTIFNMWEWANNHYLPASPEIQKRLGSLTPGDQVMLKGLLVLYRPTSMNAGENKDDPSPSPNEENKSEKSYQTTQIMGQVVVNEMTWRGSLNPTFYDIGCEVFYVEELEILSKHNALGKRILNLLKWSTGILFSIATVVHFFGNRYGA